MTRGTLAAVVAAVLTLAGCGLGPKPESDRDRAPAWSATLPAGSGDIEAAMAAGSWVVVKAEDAVVVLDRGSGAVRWSQPVDFRMTPGLSGSVTVVGDAVVLRDAFPSRKATRVYDLASGQLRFEVAGNTGAYLGRDIKDVAAARDALLVATCPKEYSDNTSCWLSARDLRTGAATWTTDAGGRYGGFVFPERPNRTMTDGMLTFAPDPVEPMAPPENSYVIAFGPAGGTSAKQQTATVVDGRSGAVVGHWPAEGNSCPGSYISGETYLVPMRAPSGACDDERLEGYDVRTGTRRWSLSGKIGAQVGSALVLTSTGEREQVVDPATGSLRWNVDPGTHFRTLDSDIAVTHDDRANELTGVDAATGVRRWQLSLSKSALALHLLGFCAAAGGRLVYGGTDSTVHVVDVRTGKERWVSRRDAKLFGIGKDWIVTGTTGITAKKDEVYFFPVP